MRALAFTGLVLMILALVLAGRARADVTPEAFHYDATAPLHAVFGPVRLIAPGVKARDVTYETPAGVKVTGEMISPQLARGQMPIRGGAILFVHWLGEPKTTNHTEFEADAAKLARHGVTSLLVDTMWAAPKWFNTMGIDAATDYRRTVGQVVALRRGLDLLAAQPNVDPGRIAYVGHDFGAMMGALVAGADARPSRYVLITATATLPEWYLLGKKIADRPGYEAAFAPLDLLSGLSRSHAKAYLFQISAKDEYVPNERGLLFFGAAPTPKEALVYGAGHDLDTPQVHADRVAWLVKELG